MMFMNLRGLDLNLIPVFEAIFTEGGITRAAERLNLTQPAVSNALARLRVAFNDQLFVRGADGMTPTSAAKAMIGPVREALAQLRVGLDPQSAFDPARSTRVFNIAAADIATLAILPALARQLERERAKTAFHWLQAPRQEVASDFAAGQLDFAIDIPAFARPDLASQHLFSDRYVCVLRRDHPRAGGRFTLAHFLALGHIAVSTRRRGKGVVDVALGRIGQRLTPTMRLPHFQPAFHAVMASDLALVAPLSLAQRYDVAIRDLPVETPELDLMLFWRRDAMGDTGLAWARAMLVAATPRNEAAAPGTRGRPR
jgi:DNA-binding transcriptional LysR family regulator